MLASYDKISVVGVGLIGGSIGRAAIARGVCRQVVGIGRNADRLDQAVRAGVIHQGTVELAEGVAGADLVVVCTPVQRIVSDVCRAAASTAAGAWITDVGSTKARIVEQVREQAPASTRFIGSHPLAGSEKSGFEHARPDLLEGRWVVITPASHTAGQVAEAATAFWQALGANVRSMSPGEHDRAMAWVSHLPHLVAAALAGGTRPELIELAASGWRDTTRIAAGDVELWTQILADNRQEVLGVLDKLLENLQEFRTALGDEDAQRLAGLLNTGKKNRDVVAD